MKSAGDGAERMKSAGDEAGRIRSAVDEAGRMKSAGFKVGEELAVRARALGIGGEGVCDAGGFVVFVRGLLPGEAAKVRLTDVRASFARACIVEHTGEEGGAGVMGAAYAIGAAGTVGAAGVMGAACTVGAAGVMGAAACPPDRIAPACPYFGRCGGCDLMHMSYASELEYKRQRVADGFARIAGMKDIVVAPVEGCWGQGHMDFLARYRNKGQYAYSGHKFGFYEASSHNVVHIGDCMLQKRCNADILSVISEWADSACNGASELSDVIIRTGEHTGEILVKLNLRLFTEWRRNTSNAHAGGGAGGADPGALVGKLTGQFDNIRSVVINTGAAPPFVLYGDGAIDEKMGGYTFHISHDAFFQVNTRAAEQLYNTILELADVGSGARVADLYCGAGAISVWLASGAKNVVGVETSEAAVADARLNAARNGLSNVSFICGRAESAVGVRSCAKAGLIVLDPPRRGCGAGLPDAVKRTRAGHVIYVSCDPATLCRDTARLCSGTGAFSVTAVRPVDMFPRTANIETVVLMER